MAKQAAKKKTSGSAKRPKKTASKRSASSGSGAKRAGASRSSKKPTGKTASKKKAAKKAGAKKTAKKAASKKATAKTPAAKKKAVKKTTAKKAAQAKKSAAKPAAKKPSGKAAASKPAENGSAAKSGKSGRKGITIVTPKPAKKAKAVKRPPAVPALTGSILGMGLGSGKPLIPSGPKAPPIAGVEAAGEAGGKKPKSPFTKRQLEKYREILVLKRADLLGDIDSMENEALKSQSGSLSHLPQHMAEQGSETYEQSLSLDLAAADRVLLREIDAALKRIAEKTYGLCERTGKPISKERLAELPWARYSIEAAREMERRTS